MTNLMEGRLLEFLAWSGIVHQKMKIMSLFSHHHTATALYILDIFPHTIKVEWGNQ